MSNGNFTLTVLNIPDIGRGVGLAVILQTPGGSTYLYDTGNGYPDADGNGWHGSHNTGRDLIVPFLRQQEITGLDGVIISHAHYDHFGGLLHLVDNVRISRLIDCGYMFAGECDAQYNRELQDYLHIRECFQHRRGAYRAVHAGDRLNLDDALEVEVLAPPDCFFAEDRPENRPQNDPAAHYLLNANSLILRIVHGRTVFLLAGDIETEDQRRFLLPAVPADKLACDILIAPGHGLHSAPELSDAARPRATIASCFAAWLDACTATRVFAAHGGRVYVTGKHGRITVTSTGKTWNLQCENNNCSS